MTELYTILWIIGILLFVCFFAGIEIAFITASRLSIELKKKQGRNSGIILSRLMETPAQFLTTCLIGFNFFLVIYVLLVSGLMKNALWIHFQNPYARLFIDTLVSGILVLLLGIFLPKAVFRAKNDPLLSFFAPVLSFFHWLFKPFANAFVSIAQNILDYLFNVKIRDKDEAFSKIDLDYFISHQSKEQNEDNQEMNSELFENALSLPAIKIRQCLVPRTEIEGIDIATTVEAARKRFIDTKLSKLIVFDENIDNILGYIHQLDLFKKPPEIKSILLPIPAVPESMGATDLIGKFSKEQKSIAWVVDEFGGTAGVITMEDVLEEIFGEINDEYDTQDFEEKQVQEGEYIFSGRLELDYLNEKYGFAFPENESETLSGYIINEYETIPKLKERIILDRYEFDILDVSDTRIERVKMKILR